MKELSQKGALDFMVVAAIAIVLAVGGFALYRVTNSSDENSSNSVSKAGQASGDEGGADSTETNESQEESSTKSYIDEMSGLSFNYPGEWGEARKTDLVEKCDDGSTTGSKYIYDFSNADTQVVLESEDFKFAGLNFCYGEKTSDPVSYFDRLPDSALFSDENATVFAQADSCIGPVENKYINASVPTDSKKYKIVGLYSLDTYQLSESDAVALCEDEYKVITTGLSYDDQLRAFVHSISVK